MGFYGYSNKHFITEGSFLTTDKGTNCWRKTMNYLVDRYSKWRMLCVMARSISRFSLPHSLPIFVLYWILNGRLRQQGSMKYLRWLAAEVYNNAKPQVCASSIAAPAELGYLWEMPNIFVLISSLTLQLLLPVIFFLKMFILRRKQKI
jgi:hypothetical protein